MDSRHAERFECLRRIKDSVSDQYLAQPGIQGIGVGLKEVGGEVSHDLAIRIYVAEKGPNFRGDRIPRFICGAPTDVIELTEALRQAHSDTEISVQAAPDRARYDVLQGGMSIGRSEGVNGQFSTGTLGLIVTDTTDGNLVLLSNHHVLCGSTGNQKLGDTIVQPSMSDGNMMSDPCGDLKRYFAGNVNIDGTMYGVDGAIASLADPDFGGRPGITRSILDIAPANGNAQVGPLQAWPALHGFHDLVRKRGCQTRDTEGLTFLDGAFDYQTILNAQHITLKNQFLIGNGITPFATSGDSGSVVIDSKNYVIGLLHSAGVNGGIVAAASPIRAVLSALRIRLW